MRDRATLAAGITAAALLASLPHAVAAPYALTGTIAIPASADNNQGGRFSGYDISAFDPVTQLDYVADRSNASVDIFSAATNSFVGRIGGTGNLFTGQLAATSVSGPDGVQVINIAGQHQVYAGNGNSTLLGFNIGTPAFNPQVTTLATGPASAKRVDEMSFDPNTRHLLVANNAATVPFSSLIDTRTGGIISKTVFDGTNNTPLAGSGIEASDYDARTGKFYLAIPQIGNSATNAGGLSEIDPNTGAVLRTFDFSTAQFGSIASCSPTGVAAASNGQILVGCGNASQSIVIDPTGAGSLVATFPQVSGEDQVYYDPTTNRWFLAARFNPGGPVLGIIDARTDTFLQNVATTPLDHSVAVDPISGKVFVPFGADPNNTICPNGCIGVFQEVQAVPEPGTLPLIGAAIAVLAGWARTRRRR